MHTTDGGTVVARRAVVASIVAPTLYADLLAPADVPDRVRGMRFFQLDPSTIKVELWALSGEVPGRARRPSRREPCIADGVADMVEALGQVSADLVPARPFMLAGQMTTTDPTRSPAGAEMWAYTHVPQRSRGDAGEEGIRGEWDHDDLERFADRMQARFEVLAPGFGARVLERRILSPSSWRAATPT